MLDRDEDTIKRVLSPKLLSSMKKSILFRPDGKPRLRFGAGCSGVDISVASLSVGFPRRHFRAGFFSSVRL